MANRDKNLPKGWHYLLTKRAALKLLRGVDLDSANVICTGPSYSEKPDWTWLTPWPTKSYRFGSAVLIRSGSEREIHLELEGLREKSIGEERAEILEFCTMKFSNWLRQHPPLPETAPREEERFSFEFQRVREDGSLVLENA